MPTVFELNTRFQSGAPVTEAELDQWVMESDVANAGGYFAGDAAQVNAAVKNISNIVVTKYLNNPNVDEVPLRRKTKFCLLLNNFALYPPVRGVLLESLDSLTSIFESSIKEEGTMPFDSELGRMSEHVLVLLMRVTDYKLKAAAVHEFAEGNTQFAIQLLLAILLKEPPYEFALRCNCISGLYGSTQPQAFFNAGEGIQEHSCAKFTEKVDFMLNLMLRLQAMQVVSDVLSDALASSGAEELCAAGSAGNGSRYPCGVEPTIVRGVNNMMKTIMNIFKFCSQGATQWRQHILLSTTFLDGTVVMYVQSLATALQDALAKPVVTVPGDLAQSLNLAFRFGTFASYHLGEAAAELRIFCTFFHDLFKLSIRPVVMNAQLSGQFMMLYTNLLHLMCNVDALAGDSQLPDDELLPELRSESLKATVENFIKMEVGGCGLPFTQAWHTQFQRADADAMLAKDSVTYQIIDDMFTALEKQLAASAAPPAPAAPATVAAASDKKSRLLGDMPSLKPKASNKVSIAKAAAPVKVQQRIHVVNDNTAGVDPSLLCALTGNVMKNPVTSPYGNTFEKEAILSWLQQNGSVCPITGKPLTAEQLTPNQAIANKIMQQMVTQTMAAQPQADEDDLYNF